MLRTSKKKGLDKLSEDRFAELFPPGALDIIQQMVPHPYLANVEFQKQVSLT